MSPIFLYEILKYENFSKNYNSTFLVFILFWILFSLIPRFFSCILMFFDFLTSLFFSSDFSSFRSNSQRRRRFNINISLPIFDHTTYLLFTRSLSLYLPTLLPSSLFLPSPPDGRRLILQFNWQVKKNKQIKRYG